MNEKIQKRLDDLTPKDKKFYDLEETDSQKGKLEYGKTQEINTTAFTPGLYKETISSRSVKIDIFDPKLNLPFSEIFKKKSEKNESRKSKSDQKSSVEFKSIQNIELALAIRELLSSFDTQDIGEDKIKGLERFRKEFKKVVEPSLPPERKINDRGTRIVSRFKKKVLTEKRTILMLKLLKGRRLVTPITELFDFVLYLKDSSHKYIRDIEIRDDEDRLSYHYYTGRKNDEYIYLDDILFGNIGLVWQDDCSDDTKLKISDCLKLQRERDEGKLEAEFDIHKTKDAKIYACYSISQNPYLSAELF